MDLHPTLKRQLAKAGIDAENLPGESQPLRQLFKLISATYSGADQDRYTLERSIEISSREMRTLNEDLQNSNDALKANQVQLVHSEKMASLGQLAAGVAHEINNPVSFLISNLERLSEYQGIFKVIWQGYDDLEKSLNAGDYELAKLTFARIGALKRDEDFSFLREDTDNLLHESVDGANRVKEIVQNLKTFARIDESDLKVADLNEGIETTLKIIWNEIKYKCEVVKNLSPLPPIPCFPGRLNQVFMNLLMNAAQAIPDKGEITIESKVVDDEIAISISDSGAGISKENMEKLFTPFFTTKPVGKGTGLGLSISFGIVKKHGGRITVASEPGKGATFTVHLPVSGGVSND